MQKKIRAILSIAFFSVLIVTGLILAGCVVTQVPQDYGYQPQDYVDGQQDYSYEPPPFDQELPPDMVVAPSGNTYVYMAPDYPGVYFYQGGWYRWWNGGWYIAPAWRSGWSSVRFSAVPQVIVSIPPTYVRQFPSDYRRLSYRDYHSNWKKWDERHYWHSQEWYRHELRDDVRRERTRQAVEAQRQNERNRKVQQHEQRLQEKTQQKEQKQQQKVQQQQEKAQQHEQKLQEKTQQKEQKQQQKLQQQQEKAQPRSD
jgi:hypothetical protein